MPSAQTSHCCLPECCGITIYLFLRKGVYEEGWEETAVGSREVTSSSGPGWSTILCCQRVSKGQGERKPVRSPEQRKYCQASLQMPLRSIHAFSKRLLSASQEPGVNPERRKDGVGMPRAPRAGWTESEFWLHATRQGT